MTSNVLSTQFGADSGTLAVARRCGDRIRYHTSHVPRYDRESVSFAASPCLAAVWRDDDSGSAGVLIIILGFW